MARLDTRANGRHRGAEEVLAWGKPMLLDTNYAAVPSGQTLPRLAELSAQLIERYPQIGPIFA